MRIQTTSLLFLVATAACGAPKKADIGDEKGLVVSELSAYVAVWDGYAEGFTFNGDNTDRVRITINEDGSGTFRVGGEELFGLATDPNGLYPPTHSQGLYTEIYPLTGLRSGFEFPIVGAGVSDERLQFDVDQAQLMDSWCALQPSTSQGWTCGSSPETIILPNENGQHKCYLADGNTTQDSTDLSETNTPVDCNVAVQCYYCACDGDSCWAKSDDLRPQLDAALTDDGEKLEGTLILGHNERISVRMKRQP